MTNQLKTEVFEANLLLVKYNLVVLTWGNVSTIDREEGIVYIKPSGISYDNMDAEQMVLVDMQGNVIMGTLNPSSDTPTHLELYRNFPTIKAIVHTHSRNAVAWAQASRDIPAYGTTHADYFYGRIPCTRKLTSQEISENYEENTGKVIVETFRQSNLDEIAIPGVLVANHGVFTWGSSARNAVENALVLEECAEMAMMTEFIYNDVCEVEQNLLDKHYFRKHGKDAYYGQTN